MHTANHCCGSRNDHDQTCQSVKRGGENTQNKQCQDFKENEVPKFTFRSATFEIKTMAQPFDEVVELNIRGIRNEIKFRASRLDRCILFND